LQSIHDCLKPGGIFVLDLANRDCLIQHPGVLRNWWKRGDAFVLEKTSFDPTTSIATTTNVLVEGGTTRESEYRVRLFSLHEIVAFLGEIGFSIEKGYGGYDGKPLGILSQRMVFVARK
jgi:SAM-dependent methyltransferase